MPTTRNNSDGVRTGRISKRAKVNHQRAAKADKNYVANPDPIASAAKAYDRATNLENNELRNELSKLKIELKTLMKRVSDANKTQSILEAELAEARAARSKTKESNFLLKQLVEAHRTNRQRTKAKRKVELADLHSVVVDVNDTLHFALRKQQITHRAECEIWYNKGCKAAGRTVSYSERKRAQDSLEDAKQDENKELQRLWSYVDEMMEMTAEAED